MSWKNIKTFLIILFLCINILLLTVISNSHKAQNLTESNIDDTVALLKANNIEIDKSIIPKSVSEYSSVELLSITDYDNPSISSDYVSKDIDGNITITLPEGISSSNTKNFEKKLKSILVKYGFNDKTVVVEKKSDRYYVLEKIEDMQIYNNILKLDFNSNNIILSGTWYDHHISDSYKATDQKTVYATSALISYISEPNHSKDGTKLVDISFGYHALIDETNINAKSVSAAPCYCLTDDKGNSYYYNILEGSFVE